MTACPRHGCGGAVGLTWQKNCFLCARPLAGGAREPTAEEMRSRGRGAEQEPDYFSGIYRIGYEPSVDELTKAVW